MGTPLRPKRILYRYMESEGTQALPKSANCSAAQLFESRDSGGFYIRGLQGLL